MNPKSFLTIGGIVLVVVGIAGFFGIIGPTPDASIFGSAWWFDNAENWAHLVLGIAALVIAFAITGLEMPVTFIVGIVGLIVGIWGFVFGVDFLGANLENPLDNLLHLAIGIWALQAWRNAKKATPAGMMSGSSM